MVVPSPQARAARMKFWTAGYTEAYVGPTGMGPSSSWTVMSMDGMSRNTWTGTFSRFSARCTVARLLRSQASRAASEGNSVGAMAGS